MHHVCVPCLQVVGHSPLQQLQLGVPLPLAGWRELGSCLGGLQQLRELSFAGSCMGDAALQVGGWVGGWVGTGWVGV
jgi:hypothetical protein